eukprot:1162076-Pelagomonas_calceolata.AAC.5
MHVGFVFLDVANPMYMDTCVYAQGLEAELAALEADASSLLAKLEELKGRVGDQSLEEGATVVLASEPGQVGAQI